MMRGKFAHICVALFVAFGAARVARADNAPPIIEGQARVLPVLARNGMVVAQEGRAARIGVDILERGGNAVDAAVATAFALAVTLPRAGNLGGGGFMLIRLAKEQKTIALDYRETAPAATTPEVFLNPQGLADPSKSRDSGLAVGVPGTVAGLAHAHEHYGSGRLALADLIAPAIALARDGIIVEDDLADSLPRTTRLRRYASSRAIFLRPDGSNFERGDRLVQRDLAGTLEAIAQNGPRAFYEGSTAENIAKSVRNEGGRMNVADLAGYKPAERRPLSGTYRGHEILAMPPPSSGGVHLIELLNVLEGFDLAATGAGSADTIQIEAEAMKIAFADRAEYLGDPAFTSVPAASLISKKYAAELRKGISVDRARPAADVRRVAPAPPEGDQTTHFSVVDKDGNAVANTYTLNFSYGLGLVAEGTGVLLNNELDDFAARPDAPNAFGLVGGAANAPAPGKRPLSSMSPTIVLKGGKVELVTGSPGGPRIITTVLGMLLDVIDFGMNIAEATDAPRVHHQWRPDELRVERGLSPDTLRLLRAKGQNVIEGSAMGSTATIAIRDGWIMGAADTRQRGTLAVGY
ncbi:MAG: gamma-glutamyltranspeptidase / glutathione hydrolase [Methylobacteriaceae bacterium]|jgi:gamma-glutamyltranspeptidase/glutathione hydrolase|nr:gamma-glutamyltranspeptidase / glutathione hydrolase [Methylobacteriaceae bacterium]